MQSTLLKEIEEEITRFLSGLIRINTTNPPGNETEAANYIAEFLSREDFQCDLQGPVPGRDSVTTCLNGTGEKPSLLLLSHLDVVAANSKEWSVDPFGGVVKDGFVWGRGTMDMKGMTAIELMVLILLKRNKVKLKGDVLLAATADEEQGGMSGTGYLLRNHPRKILADYVINEGGGLAVPVQGMNIYTVQTAEKGVLWFRVKAKGVPGHASLPYSAENSIMLMKEVIELIGNYQSKVLLVPTMRRFLTELANADASLGKYLSRLLAYPDLSDEVLAELDEVAKPLADEIRPRIRMTVTPTIIKGGVKENVIPAECETVFDCRVLPGETTGRAFELMKKILGDAGLKNITFKTIQANDPSESPVDTPLFKTIEDVVGRFDPNSGITPTMATGGTDSRFFRKIGSVCYGFHPMRPEGQYDKMIKMMHGIDERISIKNLVFGTSVLYEVVKKFMS